MSEHIPPSDQQGDRGAGLQDLIFFLIVLLTAGFSSFMTYLGYSRDMAWYMAAPIAAIIGLGLLGVNFRLRRERRSGGRIGGLLAVFAIVFAFSFISNTNAFYSHLIRDDIVRESQEEAWAVFDAQSQRALRLIEADPRYASERRTVSDIEGELGKLRAQITDPNNLGMGERAQVHKERIEALLGTDLTPMEPPARGASPAAFERYADALERQVRGLLQEREAQGAAGTLAAEHARIEAERAVHRERLQARDYDRRHTDRMHRELNAIEHRVNRHLQPTPALELEEVNDKADEVGKFKYTWRNFVAGVAPVAMALSIVLGALLDLLAPVMSFAFYRPDDVSNQ